MKKGCLVSFSGIDSTGKSTYIEYLENEFDRQGIKHKVVWSRGGYTTGFELLKNFLRFMLGKRLPKSGVSDKRTKMLSDSKVSSIWYIIAMLDLIRLYVFSFRIYQLFGYTIICDRYIWDTYVDFSFEFRDKLNKQLWKILEKCYCKPDISFYFFISAEESLKRSVEKNEAYAETIDRRIERLKLYDWLREYQKWNTCISTEDNSIEEVKKLVSQACTKIILLNSNQIS